jgi:hypothetical protein
MVSVAGCLGYDVLEYATETVFIKITKQALHQHIIT